MRARARIAAGASGTMLDRESTKATQLNSVAARHRAGDLAEDGVEDVLDVALIEMRILSGNPLHKLRLDHGPALPTHSATGGCQSANRPSRFRRSIACTAPHCSMWRAIADKPTASKLQAARCRNDSSPKRGCSE